MNSPIVYAQADSRNLFIGQDALAGDLADPNVLIFSLALEEGHRQHRDTAGAKGLELLLEASQSEPKLFSPAFQPVRAGRHQNERLAEEFAARVAVKLGCAPLPILRGEEGVVVPPKHWNELAPPPKGDNCRSARFSVLVCC